MKKYQGEDMERWEIIERRVLVAVGAALVAFAVWLVIDGERAFFVALLLPVIFWVFWQAFFEDKLESGEPVSGAERIAYRVFLWARRLILGSISLIFAMVAFWAARKGMELTKVLLFAGLSLFVGWVALFGAGRSTSMSDDLETYRQRRQRYR